MANQSPDDTMQVSAELELRVTIVVTLDVLLLFNSTDRTLARNNLNLMLMLRYISEIVDFN